MIFVHVGENEELSLNRMETGKSVNEVIRELVSDYGEPLTMENGDYSTRITYDDKIFYVTEYAG